MTDHDHEPDERLAAYLDGEMTERERARFEGELRVNAQLAAELAAYERTVLSVRNALQAPARSVDLADRVMDAVAATSQGPTAAVGGVRGYRWFASVAAAAALLVVAILLNSLGSSLAPNSARVVQGDATASPPLFDLQGGAADKSDPEVGEPAVGEPAAGDFEAGEWEASEAGKKAKTKARGLLDGQARLQEAPADKLGGRRERLETAKRVLTETGETRNKSAVRLAQADPDEVPTVGSSEGAPSTLTLERSRPAGSLELEQLVTPEPNAAASSKPANSRSFKERLEPPPGTAVSAEVEALNEAREVQQEERKQPAPSRQAARRASRSGSTSDVTRARQPQAKSLGKSIDGGGSDGGGSPAAGAPKVVAPNAEVPNVEAPSAEAPNAGVRTGSDDFFLGSGSTSERRRAFRSVSRVTLPYLQLTHTVSPVSPKARGGGGAATRKPEGGGSFPPGPVTGGPAGPGGSGPDGRPAGSGPSTPGPSSPGAATPRSARPGDRVIVPTFSTFGFVAEQFTDEVRPRGQRPLVAGFARLGERHFAALELVEVTGQFANRSGGDPSAADQSVGGIAPGERVWLVAGDRAAVGRLMREVGAIARASNYLLANGELALPVTDRATATRLGLLAAAGGRGDSTVEVEVDRSKTGGAKKGGAEPVAEKAPSATGAEGQRPRDRKAAAGTGAERMSLLLRFRTVKAR